MGLELRGMGTIQHPAFTAMFCLHGADGNLTSLCRMVRSHHFIAHVRASTMGETNRTNCHPFSHGNWSFCHNGQVPHFPLIERQLEAALPDPLYAARRGSTDSEMIFLTLLANGLDDDPQRAFAKTLKALGPATDAGPIRLTCVFSNGVQLFAYRYASDGQCPTLYMSGQLDSGGIALASEPLCGTPGRWTEVPPNQLLELPCVSRAKAA